MDEELRDQGASNRAIEISSSSDQEAKITLRTGESSSSFDQEAKITIRAGESSNLSDQDAKIIKGAAESSSNFDQEAKITIRSGESTSLSDQEAKITKRIAESSSISDQEVRITLKGVESCESRGGKVGNGDGDEKIVGNGDSGDGVGGNGEKLFCVIDVKTGERVCRICHLNKWEIGKDLADLIELGCGCKGELGFAHSHCAEAWFKIRGNRLCEICSKTATNIMGVGDSGFMEEWNERRVIGTGPFSSERRRGCLNGQPFCNILMACLVIAFVLPWFFHVNLF